MLGGGLAIAGFLPNQEIADPTSRDGIPRDDSHTRNVMCPFLTCVVPRFEGGVARCEPTAAPRSTSAAA